MANTSDFRNGLILNHKNNLWKIVEFLHVKPGKGGAFVRSKLKNIRTGQVVDETFRAGEKVDVVRVEARNFTYLYNDGNSYVFMDQETFDQIHLSELQVKDVLDFLLENTNTTIAFHGDDPIEVRIPQHMNVKISETDPGERGNTAQGGSKPAVLENGVTIMVPLFIQIGDTIRVDTKEKRYIERVKE
ncbi:MAG: elongation factor P [Candidatus Marinimicrobia bacterium]|jgi:elongation factor P|nr:elongation factor P [Candidatus Neomarinimicrobiota bacterium]MDP6852389.1 elongation factor P [Candidatus Neomarinimicrobiota bacterium]